MLTLWLKILFGCVLLYAAILIYLWLMQEKMIFFPKPSPPDNIRSLATMTVEFTASDGTVLRGWLHPGVDNDNTDNCKLLIYFGGNNEELSHNVINNAKNFNIPQLYVNYRGYGQSSGTSSAATIRADALLIFDEIIERLNLSPENICLMGRSMGGYPATYVASRRDVNRLALITPFDSISNVAQGRFPLFPVKSLLRHDMNTLAEAPMVQAPTLFVLSEKDYMVPHKHSYNLIEHWTTPHTMVTLPDTTHGDIETESYWLALQDFFSPANDIHNNDDV